MANTHLSGVAAQPAPFLSERENQRAVDLIESAERSAPYCSCGKHMIAVAEGDQIWLECASRTEEQTGLAGLLSRVTSFAHARRMIMEMPVTE
jgi:hypothetical protein